MAADARLAKLEGTALPAGLLASSLTLGTAALASRTFLAWLALAGLVTVLAMRGRLAGWPAVAAVVMLALLNSLKWPDSDLAEYFVILDSLRGSSLYGLLNEESALLSIRSTEPVFRALMWLLAHVDPLPRIAFTFFFGLFVYSSLLWMCHQVTSAGHEPGITWQAAIAATIALLLAVTFSLVGHLVRQYVAGGLFFIGVFGWAYTGRLRWLVWPAIACATHNSVFLLVLPLLLSLLFCDKPRLFAVTILLTLAVSFAGRIPLVNELAEATSFLKEDGQIGLVLPVLDAIVLLGAWQVWRWMPADRKPRACIATRLLYFGIALAVLLFCIRDIPLLFFRSYFYLEFLRAPALAFIIVAGLRTCGPAAVPIAIFSVSLAALLCWLRVHGTDWSYGDSNARWPEWLDLHSTIERWQAIQDAPL